MNSFVVAEDEPYSPKPLSADSAEESDSTEPEVFKLNLGQSAERKHFRIISDYIGVALLKLLTPEDFRKHAGFLDKKLNITVILAHKGDMQSAQDKLNYLLEKEDIWPQAVLIHVGDYYIGNANFNRIQIINRIEAKLGAMIKDLADALEDQGEVPKPKLIWSRILHLQVRGSSPFSFQSTYDCTVKVNRKVTHDVHNWEVGIVKHQGLSPFTAGIFNKAGALTHEAAKVFVRDLDLYLFELWLGETNAMPMCIVRDTPEIRAFKQREKELGQKLKDLQERLDSVTSNKKSSAATDEPPMEPPPDQSALVEASKRARSHSRSCLPCRRNQTSPEKRPAPHQTFSDHRYNRYKWTARRD